MGSNILNDASIPPPPGVDVGEHRQHQQFENRSRSSSRDYEKERSRRDSRYERDDNYRNSYPKKEIGNRYDRRSYGDQSRDRERENVRDRDKNRERDFRVEEIPHSTVLVKGLEPHITEDDIRNEIIRYSLFPKEVTLVRRKNSGESRGFAFVEFQMLSEAVRWKELTQGVLSFGTICATLHYFAPRDTDRTLFRTDWTCIKCGVSNFKKRDMCFKCHSTREEAEWISIGGEGCEEVSHSASSTLLFRNLDILTTEERVLSMLGQITVLPIKNLKVAKDEMTHTSRGFAYVELHSISEATQLHDLLLSMAGNFYVDGRRVTVSYSRRSLSSMNSAANANTASAALAAAQWTNQDPVGSSMFSDSAIQKRQAEGTLNSNACKYPKYSTPDVSTYQYDKASGYYFDSVTGFYYDPNSRYYYDTRNRQYLYWDAEKNGYLSVSPQSPVLEVSSSKVEVIISSPPVIAHAPVLSIKKSVELEKPIEKGSGDKVRIAKKVAKDMEKWAKTLNLKKESARMSSVTSCGIEKQLAIDEATTKVEASPERSKDKAVDDGKCAVVGLVGLQAYGGGSDSDVELELCDEGAKALEIVKAEELRLIEWTKLACLLCKRQFPSKEVLNKHVQFSDLHKQNVNMLKLTKLTPKQLQELEKKESGYRDRAKERREKFGQPDVPPPCRLKTKYLKEKKETFLAPEEPAEPIGGENIGNKMLKAMGWTEGQGLGKSGQGMSGIIEVRRRVKSAGLGMKGASYGATASDSYKDSVRKAMQARYNDTA